MEDASHVIDSLNDNALDDEVTDTTATIANLQPHSGENKDAATAAYMQIQKQENIPTQKVGRGIPGS